ncbi:hypothetical protein QMK38_18035 [Lysinibacillus fusiformis]|nr:hypothetical protein [Lysinibacillus fusiformis]
MSIFKKEVFVTYSLDQLSKVKDILEREGIKYSYKVKDLSTDWSGSRSREYFGSFGTNSDFERQYAIFVSRRDVEQAVYLIQRTINS